MANECICGQSLTDLGISSCPDAMQNAKRLIFVPEFDNSGDKNEFANVAAVTKTALQAKFDAASELDRYYPSPLLENVEDVRAETVFQEFNSGLKSKVRNGIRTFTGYVTAPNGASSIWLEKIKSWFCNASGIYIIDKNSNFIYATDLTTKLKVQPIMIERGSFDAQLVKATDAEVQMIMITFDIRENMDDGLLRYIPAEDLDFDGLSDADVYALLDVVNTYSGIAQTTVTMTMTTDQYGLPVTGLVIGDFALYNNTGAAAVIPSSVTESADGVYDIVFPSQTVGHVIQPTVTKSRYDFEAVNSTTFTIV